MWKRIELHHHTIASDGKFTPEALAQYLHDHDIMAASLTDHNTTAGYERFAKACADLHMETIQGMEVTTWYGHLLAQGISSYFEWEDFQKENADLLLERIHKDGGVAGPAHPCSIPYPFSNGMAWTMQIHDWHLVDFLEIVNNAHPLYPDNQRALYLWKAKVLEGFHIQPVSGMDLHQPENMAGWYTTWMDAEERKPLSKQFHDAIRYGKVQVTNGPVLDFDNDSLFHCSIPNPDRSTYLLTIETAHEKKQELMRPEGIVLSRLQEPAVICVYDLSEEEEYPRIITSCFDHRDHQD